MRFGIQLSLFNQNREIEIWIVAVGGLPWDEEKEQASDLSYINVEFFETEEKAQKHLKKLYSSLNKKKVRTRAYGMVKASEIAKVRTMNAHELKMLELENERLRFF